MKKPREAAGLAGPDAGAHRLGKGWHAEGKPQVCLPRLARMLFLFQLHFRPLPALRAELVKLPKVAFLRLEHTNTGCSCGAICAKAGIDGTLSA